MTGVSNKRARRPHAVRESATNAYKIGRFSYNFAYFEKDKIRDIFAQKSKIIFYCSFVALVNYTNRLRSI
jgi:hypothetical protein